MICSYLVSSFYIQALTLKADGSLAAYGQNLLGQLGLPLGGGTQGPQLITFPNAPPNMQVLDAALGWTHSIVLTSKKKNNIF